MSTYPRPVFTCGCLRDVIGVETSQVQASAQRDIDRVELSPGLGDEHEVQAL